MPVTSLDDVLLARLGEPSALDGRTVATVATPCLGDVEALCARFGLSLERLTRAGGCWTTIRVTGPRHVVRAFDELARSCRGLPILSPWAL